MQGRQVQPRQLPCCNLIAGLQHHPRPASGMVFSRSCTCLCAFLAEQCTLSDERQSMSRCTHAPQHVCLRVPGAEHGRRLLEQSGSLFVFRSESSDTAEPLSWCRVAAEQLLVCLQYAPDAVFWHPFALVKGAENIGNYFQVGWTRGWLACRMQRAQRLQGSCLIVSAAQPEQPRTAWQQGARLRREVGMGDWGGELLSSFGNFARGLQAHVQLILFWHFFCHFQELDRARCTHLRHVSIALTCAPARSAGLGSAQPEDRGGHLWVQCALWASRLEGGGLVLPSRKQKPALHCARAHARACEACNACSPGACCQAPAGGCRTSRASAVLSPPAPATCEHACRGAAGGVQSCRKAGTGSWLTWSSG